jgi:hypothetical protein
MATKPRYKFKNMIVGESFAVKKEDEQKVRNAVSHFVKDSEPEWIFKVSSTGKAFVCKRLA